MLVVISDYEICNFAKMDVLSIYLNFPQTLDTGKISEV